MRVAVPCVYVFPLPQLMLRICIFSFSSSLCVTSSRHCDGPASTCQSPDPVTIDVECVSLAPRVFIIDRFISDFEADTIIQLAKDKVKRSQVGNSDGEENIRLSNTRTSRNAWLAPKSSHILESVTKRVSDALRIPFSKLVPNSELMQVVHYRNFEKYDSHHDWGVDGFPESRYITMLMYLTTQVDEGAGGETSFPKGGSGAGFKVQPKKGTSVIFYNLLPDGNGDDLALHAALPVVRGEKWMANYWVWDPKRK